MRRLALLAAVALAACGPSVKKVAVDPPTATLDQKGANAVFKAKRRVLSRLREAYQYLQANW